MKTGHNDKDDRKESNNNNEVLRICRRCNLYQQDVNFDTVNKPPNKIICKCSNLFDKSKRYYALAIYYYC